MVVIERRGRKRRNAPRYPSGEVRGERAPSPAIIAARMPHRGSVNQRDCVNPMAETELGRMQLNGKISKGQYEAGVKFKAVVEKYHATISGPRPILAGDRGGYDCPGIPDCPDCECERRKAAFNEMYSALLKCGLGAVKAVWLVAAQDTVCPYSLRIPLQWGLSALRQHFDMEDDSGVRPTRAWTSND